MFLRLRFLYNFSFRQCWKRETLKWPILQLECKVQHRKWENLAEKSNYRARIMKLVEKNAKISVFLEMKIQKGSEGNFELWNHVQLSIMTWNYQQKLEKLQFWILIFSTEPENLRRCSRKRFIRDFDDFTPPSSKFHRDFEIIRSFMAVKGENLGEDFQNLFKFYFFEEILCFRLPPKVFDDLI